MTERRVYERMRLAAEVVLRAPGDAASSWKGHLEDISFSGFAVSLQEKTGPLAAIDFELRLPELGEFICGKGIIRHANEDPKHNRKIFIIGVEFIQVNKDTLAYIIKKIQRKIAHERRPRGQTDAAGFVPY